MIGGTSRLHPPFGLDFEADEADTNPHLSNSILSTKGFRQGSCTSSGAAGPPTQWQTYC